MSTVPLISHAPPQPWTFIEARTLLHVESSIDAKVAGVPVCSVPKSKRGLAALLTEVGSITEIEWQAIYDALAFTARTSPVVADAHNRAVDHVCKILGKPIEPNPCDAAGGGWNSP
jgi:hypothetical protein